MAPAPIVPTAMNDTAAYKMMAVRMVMITARGMVFLGSTTSSANVAIRAYPVKAKKRIAADSAIPLIPNGANGVKFRDSTDPIPPKTK